MLELYISLLKKIMIKSCRYICYFVALILFFSFLPSKAQVINMRNVKQEWQTDQSKHLVNLDEFRALLVRDGIKPVDHPMFWNIQKAKEHYFENEPMSVVEVEGEAKAYPLSILMFHEIVNDSLNGYFYSVTYCPLCNSSLVFDRSLEFAGSKYLFTFGTSGMLRNSNLVMWDRQTESWWQQFTGKALVGKMAGATLNFIPSMVLSLNEFQENYPDGKVLSTQTGSDRLQERYGTNPYVKYDALSKNKPRLFFDSIDTRLPAMERVVHVPAEGTDRGYTLSSLKKNPVINDVIGQTPVVLFFEPGTRSVLDEPDINKGRNIGTVTVFSPRVNGTVFHFSARNHLFRDKETRSSWTISGKCVKGKMKGSKLISKFYSVDFAFAWFAFYPNAEIYEKKQ